MGGDQNIKNCHKDLVMTIKLKFSISEQTTGLPGASNKHSILMCHPESQIAEVLRKKIVLAYFASIGESVCDHQSDCKLWESQS